MIAKLVLVRAYIRLLIISFILSCSPFFAVSISESVVFSKSSISVKQRNEATEQRVLVLIKPDAVERALIGTIISRFENKGMRLLQTKIVVSRETLIRQHYRDLEDRHFFSELLSYMTSGQCIAMVWAGDNAISLARKIVGSTHPDDAESGTIRGDYCFKTGQNLVHCSDSAASAKRELQLWFPEEQLL